MSGREDLDGIARADAWALIRSAIGELEKAVTLVRDCREPAIAGEADLGALAEAIYAARRIRDRSFAAGLFGEPAWDILLDLFIAECRGKQVSISSACIGAAVPGTTALRWLGQLEQAGLILRRPCRRDARRVYVALSREGAEMMERLIRRLARAV